MLKLAARLSLFLRKLHLSGGLRRLLIIGMKHDQSLNDLKHGFLENGGRCELMDNSYTLIAEETVSYKNLGTVSRGVRDILQKDGVLCS